MAQRGFALGLLLSAVTGLSGGFLGATLVPSNSGMAQDGLEAQRTVIRAEEFQLVDRMGTVRARIAFSPDGDPYLAMTNQAEMNILWLGLSNESGLAIRDLDGKTRLVLSLDSAGTPSLVVRDRQHRTNSFHP
ncbi:MAG: hypothetical protein ABI856_11610 [Nitrospira sp.]